MKILIRSKYAKLFALALVVIIVTAYFSEGFHHPDEHFQILEFSNYKLGEIPASDLPWEFEAKIRPGLQPFIAFCLTKFLAAAGIMNPFMLTFIFRLLTGIFAWYVFSKLCLLLLPEFALEKAGSIFILSSLLLWFVPYFIVRFSSETLSGITLLYAVYLLLIQPKTGNKIQFLQLGMPGFLLGLSFYFRFQMGFAILGVGLWLLFIKKYPWNLIAIQLISGISALLICTLIDFWFYDDWVITPLYYFDVNILQNKASEWGVSPWWNYFVLFFNKAAPPLSIPLLVFCFLGIIYKPTHIFSFIFIPFLLGHMLIGHKEMRFLVPVMFAFIFLACQGGDYLFSRLKHRKIWNYLFMVLLVLNFSLLLFRMFSPAAEPVKYYKYLYRQSKAADITLVSKETSIYRLADLPVNYYKPANLKEHVFTANEEIIRFLEGTDEESAYYFSKYPTPKIDLQDFTYERTYCYYPEWLLTNNFNNWQDRVRIWSIYRIEKK